MLKMQFLLIMILFSSCQSKIDLSNLTLKEDVDDFIEERSDFFSDNTSPATGLPILYTYKIDRFSFGSLNLIDNSENTNIGINKVGFFLYKPYNKDTNTVAGLIIDYNQLDNNLYEVLEKKYGTPTIVAEKPTNKVEGILHGISAYQWKANDYQTVFLSKSYSTKNNKQAISTTVYILNNDAQDITTEDRSAVDRLLKTFTP